MWVYALNKRSMVWLVWKYENVWHKYSNYLCEELENFTFYIIYFWYIFYIICFWNFYNEELALLFFIREIS